MSEHSQQNPHSGAEQAATAAGGKPCGCTATTASGGQAETGTAAASGSATTGGQAGSGCTATSVLDAATIAATLPHAEPFLFIDKAELGQREIRGSYTITGKEDFLRGHFKGRPVFPASIMLEALGQLAVLYLLKASDPDLPKAVDPEKIFFTSCDGVRCQRVCTPGDRLDMVVRPKRLRHPASAFEGAISVGSEKAAFAEKISLVFDFKADA